MDCVFCAIVGGEAPASQVFEDDVALAFMDIAPATPGHLLVIPKRHATRLADLDPDVGAHLFRVAHQLALALSESPIPVEGVNLFLADGEVALQEVPHVHLHVLPRTRGDGFTVDAEFGRPDRAVLDEQAAQIRAAIG